MKSNTVDPEHPRNSSSYVAFAGDKCLATGELPHIATVVKEAMLRGENDAVLVFDGRTSEVVELDLRGTLEDVLARVPRGSADSETARSGAPKRGPGRPRLGVISREVTLLPGQWEWLDQQPGGASGALRRLVFAAKKSGSVEARTRQAKESLHRFMTVMAGDLPGFEEALRAFYRKHWENFDELIRPWPEGIRAHLNRLLTNVIAASEAQADRPSR